MKKSFFPFVLAACAALINVSCSVDESPRVVPDDSAITYNEPKNASSAAFYEIPENAIQNTSTDGIASLTGLSITESGKAIVEVTTDEGTLFATYDADVNGSVLYIKDEKGVRLGTIICSSSRSSEDIGIRLELTVTIKGKTFIFKTSTTVPVKKTTSDDTDSRTKNVARTWSVLSMNIVLEGDVNISKLENSGNLKVFADEAQNAGANLSQGDYNALCKVIKTITLDKNGLFVIEYDNNTSDVCTWKWVNEEKKVMSLTPHKNTECGNKFLPANSTVTVDFTKQSTAFTLKTDISDSKHYTAVLTVVMEDIDKKN